MHELLVVPINFNNLYAIAGLFEITDCVQTESSDLHTNLKKEDILKFIFKLYMKLYNDN